MQRAAIALALALQLLGCVAPANAVILCVSNDGCVEIELAQPGTRRCVETTCDDGHGVDPAHHTCRDVPILNAVVASARAVIGDGGGPTAVLPPAAARPDQPAAQLAPPAARATAPASVQRPRTVVLQL